MLLRLPITVFHKSFMMSSLKTANAISYHGLPEMLYYGYTYFIALSFMAL